MQKLVEKKFIFLGYNFEDYKTGRYFFLLQEENISMFYFSFEKKYIKVKLKLTSAVAFDKIWIVP